MLKTKVYIFLALFIYGGVAKAITNLQCQCNGVVGAVGSAVIPDEPYTQVSTRIGEEVTHAINRATFNANQAAIAARGAGCIWTPAFMKQNCLFVGLDW